jgi:glycosyltransferase involved in cell wall biosynthesis
MKLGLVARADNSGLGVQTYEFYIHMKPAKTMVVDISMLNGNQVYLDRYPGAQVVHGIPAHEDMVEFLTGLDVIFIAESPYDYKLYNLAREMGVKTACQYNYEFVDWFSNPALPKPDMLIAPSRWYYNRMQHLCDQYGIEHVYLHCPVNRESIPRRTIKHARTFLHCAGKSAAHDRNGTLTVIEAAKYLDPSATIKIHFQGQQGLAHQATHSIETYVEHIKACGNPYNTTLIQHEYDNYADAYSQGDVMIMPRRYGGNCLPLNEALSAGMPVIMPDISPNNEFLPKSWLVPATIESQFTPRTTIEIYGCKPEELAAKINEFVRMGDEQFANDAEIANTLAESISWPVLKPRYKEEFERLCTL